MDLYFKSEHMASTQHNNELVVVHTKGTMSAGDISLALPGSRFFRLLTKISYTVERKDGSSFVMYEGLWLTNSDDSHAITHYAKMQPLRPYFAGKSRVKNTIYWSGESPAHLVDAFVEAANFKGKPEYIDKGGYGFIRFKEESDIEDLPVLMGLLNFYQPEGSRYNFAFQQENQRGGSFQQTHFGPRSHGKKNHTEHKKEAPRKDIPKQPKSSRTKKVKNVDEDGFVSYTKMTK